MASHLVEVAFLMRVETGDEAITDNDVYERVVNEQIFQVLARPEHMGRQGVAALQMMELKLTVYDETVGVTKH